MPAWTARRPARGRRGRLRRLRRRLRRHLRRHLRRRGALAAAPTTSIAAPTCAMRWRSRSSRRRPATTPRSGCRRGTTATHLQGQRRQAGYQAADLPHLRRPGRGADPAGLLLGPADLPDLPRHRQGHPRAVRCLRGRRPRSSGPRRCRSRFRRASTTACGSARPATASPESTAARPAISTSRSERRSTRSSSATAMTCIAKCRSRSPPRRSAAPIQVPTLGGKAEIELPEGVQNGKVFRLRGKGIKGVRSAHPGDLYAHIAGRDAGAAHRQAEADPAGTRPEPRRMLGTARRRAAGRTGSRSSFQ